MSVTIGCGAREHGSVPQTTELIDPPPHRLYTALQTVCRLQGSKAKRDAQSSRCYKKDDHFMSKSATAYQDVQVIADEIFVRSPGEKLHTEWTDRFVNIPICDPLMTIWLVQSAPSKTEYYEKNHCMSSENNQAMLNEFLSWVKDLPIKVMLGHFCRLPQRDNHKGGEGRTVRREVFKHWTDDFLRTISHNNCWPIYIGGELMNYVQGGLEMNIWSVYGLPASFGETPCVKVDAMRSRKNQMMNAIHNVLERISK